MKYKIACIIILSILFTSIIYLNTKKDKIDILALGDGLATGMTIYHVEGYDYNEYLAEYFNENNKLDHYYKYFSEVDESASSLINKINNNIESIDQKIKIKQAIKEADIITITLGMDELNNYSKKNLLGTTKITGFLNKYEEIIKEIRKLNNKNIYIIGLYESKLINQTKISKINQEIKKLASSYNLVFVDIEDLVEKNEFFNQKNNYYMNYKGQEYIFNKIKHTFEKNAISII